MMVLPKKKELDTLLAENTTLLDCLLAERDKVARPYKEDALQNTKRTTASELETTSGPLRTIVTCPNTFDPLVREAQEKLKEFVVDWANPEARMFAAHAIPGLANSVLSNVINSEADVVNNQYGTVLRPVLAVLRLLTARETRLSDSTPKKAAPHKPGVHTAAAGGPSKTGRSVRFIKPEDLEFPYISSAISSKIIPDMQFVVGEGEEPGEPDVVMTVEFKTSNVWAKANLHAIFTPDLQEPHAVHFEWPQALNGLSKQCRVIVQVWAQMKKNKFAILSSERKMCILMKEGDVLYVSREYVTGDKTALLIISAAMVAMDMTDLNMLDMPNAEKLREQWPGGKDLANGATDPGIYEPTLHEVQREILQKKKTRKTGNA